MSRIIIAKQVEKPDADRKIAISQSPSQELGYELNSDAIVTDMDLLKWALKLGGTVLDPGLDYLLLYSSVEGKIVRVTLGEVSGNFINGLIKQSNGDVELGGNPLTKDTILTGAGFDFGISGAGDIVLLGGGQLIAQVTGQGEVRSDGGLTLVANGGGVSIGTTGSGDQITLGLSTNDVLVGSQYNLKSSNTPDTGAGVKKVLVWTGDGANANAAFEDPATGGGTVNRIVLTDQMTVRVKYLGVAPTFSNTGDGAYSLVFPSGSYPLGVQVEGNGSSGHLNSGTGDLLFTIDNSAEGVDLFPSFTLFRLDNNEHYTPPGGANIQMFCPPAGTGITTASFTNLGGFSSPGFRLNLTGL